MAEMLRARAAACGGGEGDSEDGEGETKVLLLHVPHVLPVDAVTVPPSGPPAPVPIGPTAADSGLLPPPPQPPSGSGDRGAKDQPPSLAVETVSLLEGGASGVPGGGGGPDTNASPAPEPRPEDIVFVKEDSQSHVRGFVTLSTLIPRTTHTFGYPSRMNAASPPTSLRRPPGFKFEYRYIAIYLLPSPQIVPLLELITSYNRRYLPEMVQPVVTLLLSALTACPGAATHPGLSRAVAETLFECGFM